jgi:transcriptional regulator with XRE-family HTH domain
VIKAAKRRGEFGKRIAALRDKNALTASDLARLTNVTPAAVWQWEKNGTQPRRDVIEKIATHFKVPVSDLTGESLPIKRSPLPADRDDELSSYPLEDLLKAIESKGFWVTVRRKSS